MSGCGTKPDMPADRPNVRTGVVLYQRGFRKSRGNSEDSEFDVRQPFQFTCIVVSPRVHNDVGQRHTRSFRKLVSTRANLD